MAHRLLLCPPAPGPDSHARAAILERDVPITPLLRRRRKRQMKLDKLTAALATVALASLCVAQRAYGQNLVNCSNPQVGTDLVLGTTVPSACLVTNTVSV